MTFHLPHALQKHFKGSRKTRGHSLVYPILFQKRWEESEDNGDFWLNYTYCKTVGLRNEGSALATVAVTSVANQNPHHHRYSLPLNN